MTANPLTAEAAGFVVVHNWRTGAERLMKADNIVKVFVKVYGSRPITVVEVAYGVYAEVAESVDEVMGQIERIRRR